MLATGTILQQRYRIVRPIGKGGMGAVYEARDERLGHVVALKEMVVAGEVFQRAFESEAQRLAPLRHPALPRVSDHFTEGEGQYLVMEYIPGEDLGSLIQRTNAPLPVEQVSAWGDQLLAALEYLHGQQPPIIHRDIKPSNLKLTPTNTIILLDFGLSKGGSLAEGFHSRSLPSLHGYTPHYAPLEQMRGVGTDQRSDLYALAATLYHLLTRSGVPDALTRAEAQVRGLPDPLRPLRSLRPDVPTPVAAALAQALALNPDSRPSSATMLRSALHASPTPERNTAPRQVPAPAPHPPQVSRWWWATGGAVGVMLLLVSVILGSQALKQRDVAAPQQSEAPSSPIGMAQPSVTASLPSPTEARSVTTPTLRPPTSTAIPSRTAQLSAPTPHSPPTSGTPALAETAPLPPPATVTSVALPSSTPMSVRPLYALGDLAEVANAELDFLTPPTGEVVLGGVPFLVRERVFKSQASPPPHDTAPTRARVALVAARALRLHLLLNTGNGFVAYQGQVVGQIFATCNDTTVLVRELRLGEEVREWQAVEGVVATSRVSRAVWEGTRTDTAGTIGYIDLLTLELPTQCITGRLTQVEVVDISATALGSLDPALNLIGLTVEYAP